jgi:hypothetical protein
MYSCKFFGTVVWAISVLAASTAIAQDQPSGKGDSPIFFDTNIGTVPSIAGDGEDTSPSFSEMPVDQSEYAGCCDMGCVQSCCPPRWTSSADFIFMQRVGSVPYILAETVPSSVPYVDLSKTAGTPVLNASDFNHGFSGGPRVGLVHHGDGGTDLEVSYFQIDGWDSSRSVGPTPDDWLIMRAPGNFLQTQEDFQQVMTWDYASRLYNAEANMRWHSWDRVSVLAGFRWVNLTEALVGIITPPTPHATGSFWDTQTKNNLYGLQIGADARLLERNRFSIVGALKTGIFENHVDETALIRMERIQFPASDSTDHLAFLGQLGVQCKYQATPRLLLKIGYEVIWMQGVALAPGQIPETYCSGAIFPQDTHVQAVGINCNSGVLYHGAAAGLEYAF